MAQSVGLGLPSGSTARIPPSGIQVVLDQIDAALTHIALDAGQTTDAGLASEMYRAALTPPYRDGQITVLEVYLDETQGNGTINGLALLAGGTDAPGTGRLFAYQQALVEKTDRDSLTVSMEITVEVSA